MSDGVLLSFIIIGIVAIILIWAVNRYNTLIRLKMLLEEGWSGISVQLKRRYDLIPNLVSIVKQYSTHEKETLETITKMRSVAMGSTAISEKAVAESQVSQALKTLFAISESYPDLKANQNFMQLHRDLDRIEGEIQLARRYYNGTARTYNAAVLSFPTNLIARWGNFKPASYFEADAKELENQTIRF